MSQRDRCASIDRPICQKALQRGAGALYEAVPGACNRRGGGPFLIRRQDRGRIRLKSVLRRPIPPGALHARAFPHGLGI